MNVFLLITIIVSLTGQTILKRVYNDRSNTTGKYFFSAVSAIAAMLFFVVTSDRLSFTSGIIPYSLLFGVFYGVCIVCNFIAIATGPLSLTALIISYSLMLPTLYGIIFLKEPIAAGMVVGIIFLIFSLYFISKKSEKTTISLKWIISVTIAFVGNGMCSVVQKMQQLEFSGSYKNEFMIMALLIVGVFLLIIAFVKEKNELKECTRQALACGAGCGALNGVVNLFVMVLSEKMAVSILFPTISAGDIILTYIISKLCYKEQLSNKQFVGFCMGIVSVVLLNI